MLGEKGFTERPTGTDLYLALIQEKFRKEERS